MVSPNTGQLGAPGSGLGLLTDAPDGHFRREQHRLAAVRTPGNPKTKLHLIDLNTGKATLLVVADGSSLAGMAIEP